MGARHFHVEVTVGHLRGSGIAKIKKAAKQEAARVMLQKLEGDPRFIGGACRLDKSADTTRTGKSRGDYRQTKSASTTWTGKSVNKQKMADQIKARFFREEALDSIHESEEQEGKSQNRWREKLRNVEVPVALPVSRSLKDSHKHENERVDRIESQPQLRALKEKVGAAETLVNDMVGTRSLKRPDRFGNEESRSDTADGVCSSETNNNRSMPGPDEVGGMDDDDHMKLVDRVKWRLARMEERQARGEGINGELGRKIQ